MEIFLPSRDYFREGGDEFYKYYSTNWVPAVRRGWTARSLGYGYQLDWRPSSPAELTRLDNAAYIGLNVALIDKLTAQFFYRIRVREYYQFGRTDLTIFLILRFFTHLMIT